MNQNFALIYRGQSIGTFHDLKEKVHEEEKRVEEGKQVGNFHKRI